MKHTCSNKRDMWWVHDGGVWVMHEVENGEKRTTEATSQSIHYKIVLSVLWLNPSDHINLCRRTLRRLRKKSWTIKRWSVSPLVIVCFYTFISGHPCLERMEKSLADLYICVRFILNNTSSKASYGQEEGENPSSCSPDPRGNDCLHTSKSVTDEWLPWDTSATSQESPCMQPHIQEREIKAMQRRKWGKKQNWKEMKHKLLAG